MRVLFYLLFAVGLWACDPSTEAQESGEGSQPQLPESGEMTTVEFYAADSLKITADYYPREGSKQIIVMCHQAGFSRGEYRAIAPKLVEAGFACLAVDLRSGRGVGEVVNETFNRALKQGLPTDFSDALQDVEASVRYAHAQTGKSVILWGSSYSATLALMVGKNESKVKKVMAFSPGVYFSSPSTIRGAIAGIQKPVFVTCANTEIKGVSEVANVVEQRYLHFFKPDYQTDHGAKALWPEKANSTALMQEVISFLKVSN